jgi:hypothetical protein
MNKWYFSKKGSITEAMNFESAKEFVVNNPDAYGWQESYTQWLPIHCINDFADITPTFKPLAEIPQEIVDEFNYKAQNLVTKLQNVNADISDNETFAQEFAQEINTYKELTQQLSPEVQANISSIEQQYDVLQQKLNSIKQNTRQAANEISKIVAGFDLRIANKSVVPLTSEPKKIKEQQVITSKKMAKPVIEVKVDIEVKDEPKDKPPVSELKVQEEKSTASNLKEPALNTNTSEFAEDISTNVETVKTRPVRPLGAKVISTRSKKSASSNTINTNSVNSFQNENADIEVPVQNEQVTTNKPIIAQTQSESTPVIANTEPNCGQSSNTDGDKIKDKIGAGVKNIFTSMFSREPSSPPISAGLKDLVTKENEKEKEAVSIIERAIDEDPNKRKRRRRK